MIEIETQTNYKLTLNKSELLQLYNLLKRLDNSGELKYDQALFPVLSSMRKLFPEEEEKDCPMDDLSPAAQSVLDAATVPTGDFCLENVNEIAAAALRAAADGCDPDWLALTVLCHLHSIADELEAQ